MKGVVMKTVNVRWVEARTYFFPDDAPTDNETALCEYVDRHLIAKGDWEYFCVKRDTRDWKIVKGKGDL